MAKNKTEKSTYQSRFGAGWITAAQFLAENMCSRKSRATGTGELPQRFWNDPYWEKQLCLQLKFANELLQEFEMADILGALKHPDAKKVYSLGLKSVIAPLVNKQKKLRLSQEKQQTKTQVENVDITQLPRKPFSVRKNPLQKLRDIDNG